MVISNSSVCGTSVIVKPHGSVLLQVAYDSCFTSEHADDYIMSILFEREYEPGTFMPPEMKKLRCPKPPVNVQCTPDGQLSFLISKHLTKPPLKLHSIHVKNGHADLCGPVLRTRELVLFQLSLSTCGTTIREKDGNITYENVIVAYLNVKKKTASAKLPCCQLRLHIQCTLDTNDLSTQNSSDLMLPPWFDGSLHLPRLQMRFAKDNLYQEFYNDRNHLVLRLHHNTTIPIEVRIIQEESNMTLILHECWATPGKDPNHQHQWPLLINGCPIIGANYETGHVSEGFHHGLSSALHHRRFIIHANYSGSRPSEILLHGMVYFHCNVSLHFPSMLDHYMPLCHKSRKNRSIETSAANFTGNQIIHGGGSNMTVLVSSHVPVYIPADRVFHHNEPGSSGRLEHEWVRITIVVSVLASILMLFSITKRKCKAHNNN
ncbi:zona pellucida sperm-binding protein 4-like isoform X2 [Pyxicephalus adspersus]